MNVRPGAPADRPADGEGKRRPVNSWSEGPSAPGGLQLYGWTALDAQNKRTTVKLSNVRYNVAVGEGAFTFKDPVKR